MDIKGIKMTDMQRKALKLKEDIEKACLLSIFLHYTSFSFSFKVVFQFFQYKSFPTSHFFLSH